jgi:hypothetical protein
MAIEQASKIAWTGKVATFTKGTGPTSLAEISAIYF